MTNFSEKYLKESERTEKKFPGGMFLEQKDAELLHAVLGITSEGGELLDAIKSKVIYGKELDFVNITEELGDIFWYCSIILRLCNTSYNKVMLSNLEKLKVRYPLKFRELEALERDLEKERIALEKAYD